MKSTMWKISLLLGGMYCPFATAADTSGCAYIRFEAPANENSCDSGSFGKKGKTTYAVNIDPAHEIHGVVIRYQPFGGHSSDIAPFDLKKAPIRESLHKFCIHSRID